MQKEQVMNHANVIIVGGDHHNGLNLARAFGIHGVTVYAMIVEKKLKKSYIGKSKYIKKYCIFQTEKDAFDDISCRGYEEGTFIIPYSDGAAQELDRRLDEFKKRFTVPSIRGKQGAIADLMAKNAQVKFAKAHDIKMADSFLLDLSKNGVDIPNGWNDFPCILKPNISANGNKLDIVVCNNKEELTEKLNILKEKDYPNILLQKFLNIDYEVVVVGAIYQNHDEIDYAVHRVIRKYPDTAGTNSFSCLVTAITLLYCLALSKSRLLLASSIFFSISLRMSALLPRIKDLTDSLNSSSFSLEMSFIHGAKHWPK